MNLNCDIVMDCVSIYKDGLASESTAKAVEEHLKGCRDCKMYYKQYDSINNIVTKKHYAAVSGSPDKYAALSTALKKRRNFFTAFFVISAAITAASIILSIVIGTKKK